jgi:hypothetical protein
MNLFPLKDNFSKSFFSKYIETDLRLSKSNKIISIGSCFAREIKRVLMEKDYNYLTGETEKTCFVNQELFKGDAGRPKTDHSSIAWERVYHTHTFNQIVQYSFGKEYNRLKEFKSGSKYYVADLLRSRIVYRDMQTATEDVTDHIEQSKKMFMDAEYLIFTMGLTEIWKHRDMVLGALHKDVEIGKYFLNTGYEDNLQQMVEAYQTLKAHNPKLKFIISVSPIHLRATFREGFDAVTASCASKSILRAVADKFCENEDVFYFPSYEIATILSPLVGMEMYSDGHHASKEVVEFIMETFDANCLID